MKNLIRFFMITIFTFFSTQLEAQISNLVINGSTTHFTMASGDAISWSYNLPVGGTASIQIWIDVNNNQTIQPDTDVIWIAFSQTDGQSGIDGPPDMDGQVNGQITFSSPVGLAPADYVLSFSNNNSTATISGTVTPLLSPAFTISGTVTVPPGKSAQYLIMNLEAHGENSNGGFWTAITDINGNFTIYMNSDTTGNPWRLGIDNAYRLNPAVLVPNSIYLIINPSVATNYPGNNFEFIQAAAEVNGTVRDENGSPLLGYDVFIYGNSGSLNRNTQTYLNGEYALGILANELPATNVWVGAGNNDNPNIVSAATQIPVINIGNVITKNLTIYNANSTISGTVRLNGNPPQMSIEITAQVQDTAFVRTFTDFNGNYTLHVTNRLFNYDVRPGQLPPNYIPYSILAHPGQTNVNFNFTLTDVRSEHNNVPKEFSLFQNYPNPFNPNTIIKWQSPIGCWQTLKIYNILGNEIATLVNEFRPAGTYEITWNAENYPSGIYFYKIQAGEFAATKTMILLR